MIVLVNGKIADPDSTLISPLDRGFLYGDGCFETLRVAGGRPIELEAHLDRLAGSAETLRIPLFAHWSRLQLSEQILAAIQHDGGDSAIIRLSVSRGRAHRPGLSPRLAEGQPTVTIIVIPHQPLAASQYRRGISAIVSRYRRIPAECIPVEAKATHYLPGILATAEAEEAGADEAIMLDIHGQVAETTVANLFWCAGGTLFTPDPSTGLLPGITRRAILELASEAGFSVHEVCAPALALASADEIFITKTSVGVLSITRLDRIAVGAGVQGPVSAELLRRYLARYRISLEATE
ncbi:MAG: aminotransferase class IV family protein [Candidatus Schekmanbacteria bacterium]|nr:aminotransferase class IV family protein [Candidatus Schekmanbacteria bacterium]